MFETHLAIKALGNSIGCSPLTPNMVFTLGLRHTFRVWPRRLALVQSLVVQASFASFRPVSENLPLGVCRLVENPYESPVHASRVVSRNRSFRRCATASALIVCCWLIATGLLFLIVKKSGVKKIRGQVRFVKFKFGLYITDLTPRVFWHRLKPFVSDAMYRTVFDYRRKVIPLGVMRQAKRPTQQVKKNETHL